MSGIPDPVPGQILRYAYLWREEAEEGEEDGAKVRPAVVVLVVRRIGECLRVVVTPITHTQPTNALYGLEISAATCKRIGLDHQRQWIIAAQANAFDWPGPDLRPDVRKGPESVIMGILPPNTLRRLRDRITQLGSERQFEIVQRTNAVRGDET